MRTVTGPTDNVVVVGAGLGGLTCALHLAGAGRRVTVLEREPVPGGRAGLLERAGYRFDTGPTVLTMPELIDEAFAAIGERLADRVDLIRLDPAYRAWFADGSSMDVIADPVRMAAEISRACGPHEADGYLRFVDYTRRMWRLLRHDFIDRNLDGPRDLLTANLPRLLAIGGFGRLQPRVDRYLRDPRTRRIFSFQALYAGLAPHRALALYTVISYLDTVAGVWFPRGGIHSVAQAMADAADKHGVDIRYGTTVERVEIRNGRAVGVRTSDREHVAADVVVLNPDLPVAYGDLIPAPAPRRLKRARYSPSCVVLHIGSRGGQRHLAHHNILFGSAWRRTFDEVITQRRLMSDPSLLLTNPSRTDPTLAPPGRHTYYLLAPVPNVDGTGPDWRGGLAERYADELVRVLERRGCAGFGAAIETREIVTPADWLDAGMAAGTPFSMAHTLTQTGPLRPSTLHSGLSNVVFAGAGTQPGVGIPMVVISGRLAAARITG